MSAAINYELFYSELYRGYFASVPAMPGDYALLTGQPLLDAITGNAGELPPAIIALVCPQDGIDTVQPLLAVVATEDESKQHPDILDVTVFIRLQVQTWQDGDAENDPFGTSPALVNPWLVEIRDRLRDAESFRTYLLSLTDEQRTGGEIMIRLVPQNFVRSDDPANRLTLWEISINHKVNISPAGDD